MNLHKAIFIAALLGSAALPAAGQSAARDFETVRSFNPALDFSNAAGLSFLSKEENISEVKLDFVKENGALTGIDGSSDSWKAGASTESFKRISERIAFHGKLSYSYSRQQNSGGPVLMDIKYNALNFYEADPTVVGNRKVESYLLGGGFSYALGDRFSIGFNTDYSSADRTKYKDPRFLNEWMDADVSAGFMWNASESFSIGLSLEYRHTLEQLSAGSYGTKDRDFYVFVDQGGYLGSSEPFDGDGGYISLDNSRPMANNFFGGSLQIVHGGTVKFYHQLKGFWRTGFYGSKNSSQSVLFTENKGPLASYDVTALVRKADNVHRFALSASWEMMADYVNSYSYKTEEGRSTVIVYYGQNQQLDRNDLRASLSYKGFFGVSSARPALEVGASADGSARLQKTTIYPNWREHEVIGIDASAFVRRNIISGKNIFSPEADLYFHTGFGTSFRDGAYAQSTTKLKSFDAYLFPQFEYETANRAGATVSFTFTRIASDKFSPYIRVSDTFHSLLSSPSYLSGRTRNTALLTVGCNF